MASDLHEIWHAETTTARDKKRLLRAALERVVVTGGDGTVAIAVEWKGGEVTQIAQTRSKRGEQTRVTDAEIVDLVRKLAVSLDDTQVARVLNRRSLKTATGLTFTKRHVQAIRMAHQIPCARQVTTGDGPLFTAEEAARELAVSSTTIHQWLRAGLLRGSQVAPGAPWRIVIDDEARMKLKGKDAPEGWVGLDAAAARLGVSKQTVITWVKEDRLKAVRVTSGRRTGWRICVESSNMEKQGQLF